MEELVDQTSTTLLGPHSDTNIEPREGRVSDVSNNSEQRDSESDTVNITSTLGSSFKKLSAGVSSGVRKHMTLMMTDKAHTTVSTSGDREGDRETHIADKEPSTKAFKMPGFGIRLRKDEPKASAGVSPGDSAVKPPALSKVITLMSKRKDEPHAGLHEAIECCSLQEPYSHTQFVFAVANYAPLVMPGISFSWYRMPPSKNVFVPIEGVHEYYYLPCADDIGCKICVQCTDTYDKGLSRYLETSPIKADAQLIADVDSILHTSPLQLQLQLLCSAESGTSTEPLDVSASITNEKIVLTNALHASRITFHLASGTQMQVTCHTLRRDVFCISTDARSITIQGEESVFANFMHKIRTQAPEDQFDRVTLSLRSVHTKRDTCVCCVRAIVLSAFNSDYNDLRRYLPWTFDSSASLQAEVRRAETTFVLTPHAQLRVSGPDGGVEESNTPADNTNDTRISALQMEKTVLAAELAEAQDELCGLRTSMQATSYLEAEKQPEAATHASQAEQVSKFEEQHILHLELQSAQTTIQELRQDLHDQMKLAAEFAIKQADVKKSYEETEARLEAEAASRDECIASLQQERAQLSAELLGATNELEVSIRNKEHAMAEVAALRDDLRTKSELLQLTTQEQQATQQIIQRMELSKDDASRELEMLKLQLADEISRAQAVRDELNALKEQTSVGDGVSIADLQAQLDTVIGEKNHWKNKSESLSRDMQKTLKQSNSSGMREENERLQQRVEALEQQCTAYREAMHKAVEASSPTGATSAAAQKRESKSIRRI